MDNADENKLIADRKTKLNELRARGVNPYPYKFDKTHSSTQILDKYKGLQGESEDIVSYAGRIMTVRKMGKIMFMHIQDEFGKLQAYFQKDLLEQYDNLKLYDIGDFIGVKGIVFTTQTGETTIKAKDFMMLGKTIRPLPEKYHGIKDQELRYRKRYLDLMMNPEVREQFKKRARILKCVRSFLDEIGFLEVETPVLQTIYGGTNAKPFVTHINVYDMRMYLRVAPELYLKRLVIGGFEKVYEIARNFRNEGADLTHNPEFSMIEWYEAYVDYHKMMDRAEALIKFIAKEINGSLELPVHDKKINLDFDWSRIPMTESIKQHLKIDVNKMSVEELRDFCDEQRLDIVGNANRGSMIFAIFDKLVSNNLTGPVWIIDYPKEVSPLSKVHRDNPDLVERYELYIGGKEICDGWSELIDPAIQRERFDVEQANMRSGNEEAHPMDEEFIEALEYGFPVCGGIGMGIDRLVMLILNDWSIRDVIFFPTMKPKEE